MELSRGSLRPYAQLVKRADVVSDGEGNLITRSVTVYPARNAKGYNGHA